jgi:hypothetical protein
VDQENGYNQIYKPEKCVRRDCRFDSDSNLVKKKKNEMLQMHITVIAQQPKKLVAYTKNPTKAKHQ